MKRALTVIKPDKDARQIGDLYRKARLSLVESVRFAFECGQRLIEKKASLPHGEWLPWLRDNADVLGFDSRRTASRLIALAANGTLASHLDETTAITYSRQLWGHTDDDNDPDDRDDVEIDITREVRAIIATHSPAAVQEAADLLAVDQIRRGINTGVAMDPHDERGLDLYETPEPATRALLEVENLSGPIWEPACGPGAIVRVLRQAGHRVIASDVEPEAYGCPDAQGGIDFLQLTRAPKGVDTILTNPPFMYANDFVRHALTLVPRVIMLLRLGFLESAGRSDILDGGLLARVYPFIDRVQTHRDGWSGPRKSNPMAFAWFVWDREHSGLATLERIWCREADEAPQEQPGEAAE